MNPEAISILAMILMQLQLKLKPWDLGPTVWLKNLAVPHSVKAIEVKINL